MQCQSTDFPLADAATAAVLLQFPDVTATIALTRFGYSKGQSIQSANALSANVQSFWTPSGTVSVGAGYYTELLEGSLSLAPTSNLIMGGLVQISVTGTATVSSASWHPLVGVVGIACAHDSCSAVCWPLWALAGLAR